MAFPIPTLTDLTGTIQASQFNQSTNTNIVGTILKNPVSGVATNPYVPSPSASPSLPTGISSISGQISANQFNQATNANVVGTILKNPVSGVVPGLPSGATPSSAFNVEALKKGIFANPTLPTVGAASAYDISQNDWRVKLQLAPNAQYLYMDATNDTHILYPLKLTSGVIFPYTPTINVSYSASYDAVDLTHTNYKFHQYRNSSVGDISISAEFTAQDTTEALYLLAVIHFFKSVTKMFYGNDTDPMKGTPPPLCYLTGYGQYQFAKHPLVITNFSYSLPNDVDYIRASTPSNTGGQNLQSFSPVAKTAGSSSLGVGGIFNSVVSKVFRLESANLPTGAQPSKPMFQNKDSKEATYVPTKLTIQLGCSPMVSRYDVSNKFSVKEYASGDLLKKGFW